MSMTLNSVNTLSLLNILNKTSTDQRDVLFRMATGSRINRGADDPAGLLALTKLDNELTSIEAGINNNQRTDAVLGIADSSLMEIGNLVDEIQRLANETANDAALSAEEVAANQAQIDDALASIDRIVQSANFNGKKLLDGSLGINSSVATAGKVTDVRVFSRAPGSTDTTLAVYLDTAAQNATAAAIRTGAATADATFSVQGKLGTAIIETFNTETAASTVAKINAAKAQTGISAVNNGGAIDLYSADDGSDAFVRTRLIEGTGVLDKSDTGVDAIVTVDGQQTAVNGSSVSFSANGISMSFDLGTLAAAETVNITIKGDGNGKSGATFQLGTDSSTRATLGIDGVYTAQLGNATTGYLASLGSGGSNSLVTDPNAAAEIARVASLQVSTLQGRVGGFQKFQVRTSLNSLNSSKEGLEQAKSIIRDVDFAVESAELNRQNILLQSGMSLLGLANQQASQVLSLLM